MDFKTKDKKPIYFEKSKFFLHILKLKQALNNFFLIDGLCTYVDGFIFFHLREKLFFKQMPSLLLVHALNNSCASENACEEHAKLSRRPLAQIKIVSQFIYDKRTYFRVLFSHEFLK